MIMSTDFNVYFGPAFRTPEKTEIVLKEYSTCGGDPDCVKYMMKIINQ